MEIWQETTIEDVEYLSEMKWSKNPKELDRRAERELKTSLEEHGQVIPLVANKRNEMLVGGHQRLKIAKSLGVEEMEVLWIDLPPEEAKAAGLALDNENLQGEFVDEKVGEIIGRIQKSNETFARATGFTSSEAERFISRAQRDIAEQAGEEPETGKSFDPREFIGGDDMDDSSAGDSDSEEPEENRGEEAIVEETTPLYFSMEETHVETFEQMLLALRDDAPRYEECETVEDVFYEICKQRSENIL